MGEQHVGTLVPDRGGWARPLEFILSCLNYAVGLGNVWRFPYLVYRNGGGAFLVPYILMMFAMGLPIFFLEFIVGQYSGLGPNTAFKRMAPIFHGLGYCTLVVISMFTVYYQIIIAWTLFYIYQSFSAELPWGSCFHEYNTPKCYSQLANAGCQQLVNASDSATFSTFVDRACRRVQDICEEQGMQVFSQLECQAANGSVVPLRRLLDRVLASEEFYNDGAMGVRGADWENWGSLRWEMVVCLLLAWCIAYLCVVKGIATIGKVVYFTSVFPYLVLTALLIRGVTLPGAYEGIMFYITPRWELLLEARVWGDAASQVFYALGIGCGSLVTLSSYNKFNNNCHRDALLIGVVITLTSVYAGFAIFSILGFMAHELGVEVDEVVTSGPGLAFIAYPEAVLQMPLPQLWAALFFLMLFILGIGTQFAGIEAINTAILDRKPAWRKWTFAVTGCTCAVCFLLALPMCFQGGVFLFTLLDWNCAYWAILIIGLLELVLAAHVYGAGILVDNVREMSIRLPRLGSRLWWILWVVVSPMALVGVLAFTLADFTDASYGSYDFPPWVDVLGLLISLATLAPFPIFAVYQIVQTIRRKRPWIDLLRPSARWSPQQQVKVTKSAWSVDNAGFREDAVEEVASSTVQRPIDAFRASIAFDRY